MNPPTDPTTVDALRRLLRGYIDGRAAAKLEQIDTSDSAKREAILAKHVPVTWLADAARRAVRLHLATHTLKPLHPDAKGTTVYMRRVECSEPGLVGTHVLREPADDVAGDAAALDVYKLLKLKHADESLLARAFRDDPALLAAMAVDNSTEAQGTAQGWVDSFAALSQSDAAPTSHTLAKQVYFPTADGEYHMLAPLFPTALVHDWHARQAGARFSDEAKAARDARRKGQSTVDGEGYRDYPQLAMQKFGGRKPQNISQLNTERGGAAHLLAALPPVWQNSSVRLPFNTGSVFATNGILSRRFTNELKSLRQFLGAINAGRNEQRSTNVWRAERAALVEHIADEIQIWATRIQRNQPGWSLRPECRLNTIERQWLDPHSQVSQPARPPETVPTDTTMSSFDAGDPYADMSDDEEDEIAALDALRIDDEIASKFANWLNG
ncbi:MAG: type I-F CRISPR-associated protein Csy1, partial [Aeromicrobium sp.]|nr:type I-F CRISPR-associated protein Csy1 [Burkholderiales bacterium]